MCCSVVLWVCTQSDLEKLEGLPVAPFMDRDKVTKPSSQIGFIKFILLPLLESFTELFPHITVCLYMYRVGQKKVSQRNLHITLSKTGRISKFLHYNTLREISNKTVIKYPTSP